MHAPSGNIFKTNCCYLLFLLYAITYSKFVFYFRVIADKFTDLPKAQEENFLLVGQYMTSID
jgi:hypothetical protein